MVSKSFNYPSTQVRRFIKSICPPFYAGNPIAKFKIASISNAIRIEPDGIKGLPKKFLITIAPFKPFHSNLELVNCIVGFNSHKAFEPIHIYLFFWDKEKSRYFNTTIYYLPDTKLSFTACTGGYPQTEFEHLLVLKRTLKSTHTPGYQMHDLSTCTGEPSSFDKLKFYVAQKIFNAI